MQVRLFTWAVSTLRLSVYQRIGHPMGATLALHFLTDESSGFLVMISFLLFPVQRCLGSPFLLCVGRFYLYAGRACLLVDARVD